MLIRSIFLAVFFIIVNCCCAQSNSGPKIMASGISTATTADYYNTHGNPANILSTNYCTISFAHLQFSEDNELSEQIFNTIWPSKLFHFALNIYRYGISAYQKLESGLTFSKQFGKRISVGLKFNHHQLKIQNYGSTSDFSIDIGIKYKLDTIWTIGFHVNNLNPIVPKDVIKQSLIHTTWNIGVAYSLSDKILFSVAVQKTRRIDFGLAIDYQAISVLAFRGGISFNPFKQYVGLGILFNKFAMDLAMENSLYFTQKPQLGITYEF